MYISILDEMYVIEKYLSRVFQGNIFYSIASATYSLHLFSNFIFWLIYFYINQLTPSTDSWVVYVSSNDPRQWFILTSFTVTKTF